MKGGIVQVAVYAYTAGVSHSSMRRGREMSSWLARMDVVCRPTSYAYSTGFIFLPRITHKVCPRYCQWLTAAVIALTIAATGDRPNTLHYRTVLKRPVLGLLLTPVMLSAVKITPADGISPVKGNCYPYYKRPRHVTTLTQCTRVNL